MTRLPLRYWWVLASAALMIVGAIGTWAKALFLSVSGLDGDGWFVLIGALVIFGMLAFHRSHLARESRPWWPFAVGLLAAAIAAVVAIYDATNIQREISEAELEGLASVGWGLWLSCIASPSAGVGLIVVGLRRNELRPSGPAAPASPAPPPASPEPPKPA